MKIAVRFRCKKCRTHILFQLIDSHAKSQLDITSFRLRDRHNIYIEKSNEPREPVNIGKVSLPNKLLRAEILDNQGAIMAERLFYNGGLSDLSEQQLVSVPRGHIEFSVLDSNLSVSTMMVNKKSEQPEVITTQSN